MHSKLPEVLPVHAYNPRPRRPIYQRIIVVLLVLAVFCFYQRASRVDKPSNSAYSTIPVLVKARHGAVAAENKRCSDMGVSVLKQGGNAVDAATSATLCMGVVNMFASGIGGGGFMTVRIPPKEQGLSSEVFTVDFRETAPALSNKTMFLKDSKLSQFGGLAVAVPSELRGLEAAHSRWGSRSWKDLVEPSAKLAAGWEVDTELARRLKLPQFASFLLTHPDWKPIFAPNGRLLEEGETIQNVNYSKTLATVAAQGADAFYKGPIADALIEKIRATGGIMTQEDFDNYAVRIDRALEGTYKGQKVYTTHAPTSGPVLLHALNLIEKFNMTEWNGLNSHRLVEILKFGMAARTKLTDPLFTDDTNEIDAISTKAFADAVFPNITDDSTHRPEYYNPIFDIKADHGTSHVSVVDKNGMAVSITSTVNHVFAGLVLDPVTGVILNNEMDDFSSPGRPGSSGLWPSPYNYPEPGKRSVSSIATTIMEHLDGSFYMSIGGSGGLRIFGAIAQAILNLDLGLDASEAVEYGRVHDQLYPLVTDVDSNYPPHLVNYLRERGHNVTVGAADRITSEVQVVTQVNGIIFAASDSRKNGIAAGY